ncbi:MAG: sugar phosphate nucleotidyltransferase [Candidatus Omnitrophica bacterium]|nr:sugar phosphate nucleotidyltransferase [Candidatus Omnitrophota bacterium]
MKVIILAGGKGTRLKPYSISIPKPLVPMGEYPILEIVIRRFKKYGFNDIVLSVNHMSELIKSYFGDGKKLGVKLRYLMEDQPLGTAGPLSLLKETGDNFIVINGDVMTNLDFSKLIAYHKDGGQIATVVSFRKKVSVDLGVLETGKGGLVKRYIEKPTLKYDVSAGIYVFKKKVLAYVNKGRRMDLPDLVMRLVKEGESVRTYNHSGLWYDIGTPSDYEEATIKFMRNSKLFL